MSALPAKLQPQRMPVLRERLLSLNSNKTGEKLSNIKEENTSRQ